MTEPGHNPTSGVPFAPAARGRGRSSPRRGVDAPAPPEAQDEELADLERGRTAALLSTLGRMQLRLDVLAREQREGMAALQASLEAIEARLAGSERGAAPAPPPQD